MIPDLTVVVPCFNEEDNVGPLADRILSACDKAAVNVEIVLVDDGSSDSTWGVIESVSLRNQRVRGVHHFENQGIPVAWKSGIAAANGDFVCLIDADLQNPPEEIPNLYFRLRSSNADLVQGYRVTVERRFNFRKLYSRSLNFLINTVYGGRAIDSKSGFVIAPCEVLEHVVNHDRKYRYFQTFISVSARSKGYTILEVETLFENRAAGVSFLASKSIRVAFGVLVDFFPAWLEFGRSKRSQPFTASFVNRLTRKCPYKGWRRLLFESYFATMPIHKWLITRRARSVYLELKESEWLSRDQLNKLQFFRLKRLVQNAYNHVPYYRKIMTGAGIMPSDIRTLADLQKIPLLTKNDVRENLHFAMFSDQYRKKDLHRVTTSGSTGQPFTVYADRHQLEVRFATTLRALEWTGWRFGDKQARLWHQTLGMSRTQRIRERIDSWFMRRLFIPAFEISPKNLETYVNQIGQHRPVLVDGYAESLNFLATYVRQGGIASFSPKAIMSSAQILPANVRSVIEEGFHTRVFDKYGSREFSGIAYQCADSDNHHVMDESYILEILVDGRPALPGEVGEIVITDLNNFSVPLIRYRIGDLATAVEQSMCACGRSLTQIGRIEGRTQAIVHCGDGTWLPGTFFAHFFKDCEDVIAQFQIHQEKKGSFLLKVIPGRFFTEPQLSLTLDDLRKYVGSQQVTPIDVEIVDEIPLVRTGKRSPVVSTVTEDFQAVSLDRKQE